MRPDIFTGPARLVLRSRCQSKPVSFHFSRSGKGNSLRVRFHQSTTTCQDNKGRTEFIPFL